MWYLEQRQTESTVWAGTLATINAFSHTHSLRVCTPPPTHTPSSHPTYSQGLVLADICLLPKLNPCSLNKEVPHKGFSEGCAFCPTQSSHRESILGKWHFPGRIVSHATAWSNLKGEGVISVYKLWFGYFITHQFEARDLKYTRKSLQVFLSFSVELKIVRKENP